MYDFLDALFPLLGLVNYGHLEIGKWLFSVRMKTVHNMLSKFNNNVRCAMCLVFIPGIENMRFSYF